MVFTGIRHRRLNLSKLPLQPRPSERPVNHIPRVVVTILHYDIPTSTVLQGGHYLTQPKGHLSYRT